MMKRIFGCLFLFSVLVLAWICVIWGRLDGQLLAQFTSGVDAQLIENVEAILNDDTEYALFSMTERTMDGGEVLAYECAAYHPDALGIRMIFGSPLTSGHIERGESVVMLSKAAALELHPELDCIGWTIRIGGVDHRIIGIYETNSPLGILTEASEKSVVLPMKQDGMHRKLFLWVNAWDRSREICQRLQEHIGALHSSDAFASLAVQDLSFKSRIRRQGILFLGCAELLLICCVLLKSGRNMRRIQLHRSRAVLRLFVLGLMLTACLLPGAYLAKKLVLDESIFPARFLDPGEWLKLFRSNIPAENSAPEMPVFAALLYDRLKCSALVSGGISIACLLLYISERRNPK